MAKISAMHKLFGKYPGVEPRTCNDCKNLLRFSYKHRNYKKCEVYGVGNGEATDWNLSYEACGLFNQFYTGTHVIDMQKHSTKEPEDETIKGQVTLEDWLGGE